MDGKKTGFPMSGGFYEKHCVDHSGRGTGKYVMTPFGACEILNPDSAKKADDLAKPPDDAP